MVKHILPYIALLSLAAALLGCDPYRFRAETRYPVQCRYFSAYGSVDSHLYGFDMHPDAVVQVISHGWTQYHLAAYFTLSGGDGFELMLRPIVEESVLDSGLMLKFSSDGMMLDSAGQVLLENRSYHFPKDVQNYVTIYNEESYLEVTVGCDTVLKRYTKRKSTDDIALRTFSGSELKIIDPEWQRIEFSEHFDEQSKDIDGNTIIPPHLK